MKYNNIRYFYLYLKLNSDHTHYSHNMNYEHIIKYYVLILKPEIF